MVDIKIEQENHQKTSKNHENYEKSPNTAEKPHGHYIAYVGSARQRMVKDTTDGQLADVHLGEVSRGRHERMVKDTTDGEGHSGCLRTQWMVEDTIDRDTKQVLHLQNVRSILFIILNPS